MSLHTWRHQGPHKSSRCTTFTLNPHGGRAATGKKVLCLCAQGRFDHVGIFATVWTVACQVSLSGMGVLQARTLECIGQYLLPYPFRALCFPLP